MPLGRSVADILREPGREWRSEAPSNDEAISKLRQSARCELPTEYVELLRCCNGGEGELDAPPLWFCLDTIDESIEHNQMWTKEGQHQSFWFFGGNGGLETIGFDLREGPPWPIVMIDCIAGDDSAKRIAADISEFIEKIGRAAERPRA